jgi:hypothetical protein
MFGSPEALRLDLPRARSNAADRVAVEAGPRYHRPASAQNDHASGHRSSTAVLVFPTRQIGRAPS